MDMLPTLLAASGGTIAPGLGIDGVDLHATLRAPQITLPRQVFWRHKAGEQAAVREGDWKYLRLHGHEYLFNLAEDERERADRAGHEPARLASMKAAFATWNATMLPYPEQSFSEGTKGKYPDRP